MPVANVKNDLVSYETIIKNLRRRNVPCSVIAVPKKIFVESTTECDTESSLIWSSSRRKIPSEKRCYKKRDPHGLALDVKKRGKSLPNLKENPLSETPKKRTYRKKGSLETISKFGSEPNDSFSHKNSLLAVEDEGVPKKKAYRRKSLQLSKDLSQLSLDTDSDVSTRIPKKRPYRKKMANTIYLESKLSSNVLLPKSEAVNPLPLPNVVIPKKRAYRKKILNVVTLEPELLAVSPPSSDVDNAIRFSSVVIPKKRTYRKKIPAVPHNTPVVPLPDAETSCASASSLSDLPVKRKRGRPRMYPLVTSQPRPWEDESTSTTMTSSSTLSQDSATVPWRRHNRYFFGDLEEEEEKEELSEYELQRQKNIEENMKMLKQIFNERGLQFEEKSSETPKIRKSYNKLPLPPPRPKSARIEVRHSSSPLDFSKFCRYSTG